MLGCMEASNVRLAWGMHVRVASFVAGYCNTYLLCVLA